MRGDQINKKRYYKKHKVEINTIRKMYENGLMPFDKKEPPKEEKQPRYHIYFLPISKGH